MPMLSKNKELNQITQQFTQLLQAKFSTININNKLQNWPALTAAEFLKELGKAKVSDTSKVSDTYARSSQILSNFIILIK